MIGSLGFGLAYGLLFGLAATAGAVWLRRSIDPDLGLALALFAGGAAAAGVAATLLLRLFNRRARRARLAAAIVLLTVLTAGFDAIFLYVNYASYYSQWWPPAFSAHWFWVVASSGAGLVFYYLSVAGPMLMPFGLPAVLAGAFFLSRR